MPKLEYAEVTYEDGSHSVISVENRDQAFAGLAEHHRRAVNGEDGGPAGDHKASRVKSVRFYDDHPGEYNPSGNVPADEAKSAVADYLKAAGDVINVDELAAYVRDMANAHITPEHPHDSQYKMQEKETVNATDFLDTETGELKGGAK